MLLATVLLSAALAPQAPSPAAEAQAAPSSPAAAHLEAGIAAFKVKTPGPQAPIETLSGGNVQRAVLAASMELWKAPRLGVSEAANWTNMQAILLKMGLLKAPLDTAQAFSNAFLP